MSKPSKTANAIGTLGIVFFSLGAIAGPLLTSLITIHLDNWLFWVNFRVIFVVGSGLWFGIGIGFLVKYNPLLLSFFGCALGVLLSINPVLDLINGPVLGQTLDFSTAQLRGLNNTGSGTRIEGELSFIDSEGELRSISPMGLQANNMEEMLNICPSGEIIVLIHLDILLKTSCK